MISVIIPVYNRENTIERAIQSVLMQATEVNDFSTMEVIVVDDCSTDNTSQVVMSMNDDCIKLIKLSENRGANFARNIGVKNSRGEFIAFLDSDDVWFLNKLKEQIAFLRQERYDLVSCSMLSSEEGRGDYIYAYEEGRVSTEDILSGNRISTQTIVAKREIFEEVKFDEELPRLQDWDFIFRVSLKYKIGFMSKVFVKQYIQNNSISKNNDSLLKAVSSIYFKFQSLYPMNNRVKSKFLSYLGDISYVDRKLRGELYKESLSKRFNLHILIKLIKNYGRRILGEKR